MKRNSVPGRIITCVVFLTFIASIPFSTLASTTVTNWVVKMLNENGGSYGGPLQGLISTGVGLIILTCMVAVCVLIEHKAFNDDFDDNNK